MDFEAFKKIPRVEKLSSFCVITEKLDGTNAQVAFSDAGDMFVGSRNRWLKPEGEGPKGCDNYGFAAWCRDNRSELEKLGPGRHYGEWYGYGIGPRGYGLPEKRFALFNTKRWADGGVTPRPACCEVVTVLFEGTPDCTLRQAGEAAAQMLMVDGSKHVPGYMRPEGCVVYVPAFDALFKAIIEGAKTHPSAIEHPEAV